MNAIHKILAINDKELQLSVPDKASWHADYSDTAYIYIGNLHESLKEKDILTIFSQYGNPTHINLVKDRESGKSRGFCYLKYEDQRSCVLAIDNFNGTLIYERPMKVDHTYYRLAKGQTEDDFRVEYPDLKETKKEMRQIKSAPKLLPYKPSTTKEDDTGSAETGDNPQFGSKRSISAIKDDDFTDPMAGFVTTSTLESHHKRSRHDSAGNERSSHEHHEHRSKRHRTERSTTDATNNR